MGAVAGKIMIRPMGEYNPSTVYDILDLVKYDNKPWLCKKSNIMGVTPVEGDYWMNVIDISISNADTVDGRHADEFASADMLEAGVYNKFPKTVSNLNTMAEIIDACENGVTMLPMTWACSTYSPTGTDGAWQFIIFKNVDGPDGNHYINAIAFDREGVMGRYNRYLNKWCMTSSLYTDLSSLGLTGNNTILEVFAAMPNNSEFWADNNSAVGISDAPAPYSLITIKKTDGYGEATCVVVTDDGSDSRRWEASLFMTGTWTGWVEPLSLNKAARVIEATFTSSGWSSSAPYTQTVTVSGITENDTPIPMFVDNGSNETESKAKQKAYGFVTYFDSGNNTVTATCKYKKPESDFTVGLKGV